MKQKTMTLKLDELLYKMRNMKEGEEIGLCRDAEGNDCYGIRCIPGGMFDNGMCWIADYYGGGATAAFSETEADYRDNPGSLKYEVACWLDRCDLLSNECTVFVETKNWMEPETRWEFTKTVVQKNRLACVDFLLARSYRTYISVPPQAQDADIIRAAKAAVLNCDKAEFEKTVIGAEYGDIWPEDFIDVTVDNTFCEPTNLPTGTLHQ